MDHEPLREQTLCILLALAEGEKHGYAIMQAVPQLSGQRVTLSTGTLYGALKRLLETGWISRVSEERAPRDLKTYRLTPVGDAALRAELSRLEALVAAGRRICGGQPA